MAGQPPAQVVPELREALLTQFTSHLYKGRAHDTIVQVLESPLAKNGGLTASLHFALGLAQFELKQHREAAEQMRQCISKRNQRGFAPINTDILTAAPHHCLALCLMKLDDAAGAEKAFQAGLAENGRTDELKLDYTRFLVAQNRHVDALHKLHEIVQQNSQNVAAWRLGAEIALSKPEFLEFACDWTGEATRAVSDDLALIAQRAEALLLSQQTQPALPLWERACNCERPPRALAAQILCATVESQPARTPQNNAEEIAASRAFVDWYRRLIACGASDTVMRLNSRLDALRSALPSAAQLLDSVVAETQREHLAEAGAVS
jgi:tetratricopeptide (TPR) repeat protein